MQWPTKSIIHSCLLIFDFFLQALWPLSNFGISRHGIFKFDWIILNKSLHILLMLYIYSRLYKYLFCHLKKKLSNVYSRLLDFFKICGLSQYIWTLSPNLKLHIWYCHTFGEYFNTLIWPSSRLISSKRSHVLVSKWKSFPVAFPAEKTVLKKEKEASSAWLHTICKKKQECKGFQFHKHTW